MTPEEAALLWLLLNPAGDPAAGADLISQSHYLSGAGEFHQVEANGTTTVLGQRFLLDNRYELAAIGREDDDLVLYQRLKGAVHVRSLDDTGAWDATITTSGLPKTFDLVARGDFVAAAAGPELAFYDRTADTGTVYVYDLAPSGALVELFQHTNVGVNWTSMTAGAWTGGSASDELVLYDHANGQLRFLEANGNGLSTIATAVGLDRNDEHVVAVKLDGPAQEPALAFYNVDIGSVQIMDVQANRTLQNRQSLAAPQGEHIALVPAELNGDNLEDLLLYEQGQGLGHFWLTDNNGELAPGTTVNLGDTWTQVMATRRSNAPRSDLYLYSNVVDIVVDFVRINNDTASMALNLPHSAPAGQRSATRTVEWLNQSYRPAGMRFHLGAIHDLHDSILTDPGACYGTAGPDFIPTSRKYGDWLSRSSCTACVATEAPGCIWGPNVSGSTSCDAVATGACAASCPQRDWSLCHKNAATHKSKGCLSANTAPEYQTYCAGNCPTLSADRMLMGVYPFGGTRACSGWGGQWVHFRQGALDHQYFAPHESGHYFALSHNHVTYPPTSDEAWDYERWDNSPNQHLRGVNDTVALFHSFFFDRLGVPDACVDDAAITIPDSGACLLPHGANGCSKAACRDCVEALDDNCYRAGDESGDPAGDWDQGCVDLANNNCAAQCATGDSHTFVPERHNPMAYGAGSCADANGIFKFSRAQSRRAREFLFKDRRGLIQPTPLATVLPPQTNYAQWSYGGLYLKSYRIHWDDVLLTFEDAQGNTFTGWEKDGHRCPNRPELVVNASNPEWKESAAAIFQAGLEHRPMHIWFWGQTEAENADPDRRCYLQGVTIGAPPPG